MTIFISTILFDAYFPSTKGAAFFSNVSGHLQLLFWVPSKGFEKLVNFTILFKKFCRLKHALTFETPARADTVE